ncbi:MAG: hypothetical protein AAHH96_02825 [Candidatus Symbiodolus clandestinus]
MPKNESPTDETSPNVKPGFTLFKARGLKGRVRAENCSLQAIVDDAHTYKDLCFVKHQLEYYINVMKKQGASEENTKYFYDGVEKVNKKLEKTLQLSLEQALGPGFFEKLPAEKEIE